MARERTVSLLSLRCEGEPIMARLQTWIVLKADATTAGLSIFSPKLRYERMSQPRAVSFSALPSLLSWLE